MRPLRTGVFRPFPIIPRTTIRRRLQLQRHDVSSGHPHSTNARVSVKRPWFNRGRVMTIAAYTVIFYIASKFILSKFVGSVEIEVRVGSDAANEAGEKGGAQDGETGESGPVVLDDEEATFFSLQYPKQLPRTPYKASDPEWKEFGKLSRDSPRKKEIRDTLAETVTKVVANNNQMKGHLGTDIKWTKLWLDFTYPDHSPPQYARQGLLLVEDEMSLSTQIMPHSEYNQLRNILYPSAVITAFKNSGMLLYNMEKIKLKEAFGMELDKQERRIQLAVSLHQMRAEAQTKDNEVTKVQGQVADQKAGPPERPSGSRKQPRGEGESPFFSLSDILQVAQAMPLAGDFALAQQVFVHSLARQWSRAKLDRVPPGCCYVAGDIEVVGSRQRAKIGVLAAYQPRENKFVWINTRVRQFWDLSQAPKGGP